MDINRAQEFRIGLLVLCGFAVTIALILFSDHISFERTYRMTAFLDNAGGLHKGSPVELSGIKIGEIERIQTSKGYQTKGAIVAVLKIKSEYTLYTSSELTVGTKGIFGDSFLAISAPADPPGEELSKSGMADMVATRGFLGEMSNKGQRIMDAVLDVLSEDTRADLKRFIKDGADTVEVGKELVNKLNMSTNRLDNILSNIDLAADDIRKRIAALGDQSGEVLVKIDQTMGDVRMALKKLDSEFMSIAKSLESSLSSFDKLAQSTQHILGASEGDIIAALASIRLIGSDLQVIAQDLRNGNGVLGRLARSDTLARDVDKIAISIQNISERIAEHPEILIFGDNEEDRNKARMQRKRNQQRRAFHEGYGSVTGGRALPYEADAGADAQSEHILKKNERAAVQVVE
ncbi:MAG: MCE family protein [Planctomycetes bacterium]|nr:MCE family protein [Planctomycetota bacterium]